MSQVVGIRLTDEEKSAAERAARQAGLSLSEFGRRAVLAAAARVESTPEPRVTVPDQSWRVTAEWLAEQLADAVRTEGMDAVVTEAQGWFTVSVPSSSQAVLIIRYGKTFLRPLFTMGAARCDAEQCHWPVWMMDSSSHVARGGPTFRSREHLSSSLSRLAQVAVVAANHVV